jgi:saccharopine dehydrogenase-like NADP-dependent oxidoreductase
MDDGQTMINKGICSAADVLQFALEKKLALQPGDKDLVLMIHEIEYEKQNKRFKRTSSLSVTGDDHVHTAMAKTVGLPLAMAARLILNKEIDLTGLQIPTHPQIYVPVMEELKKFGVVFMEDEVKIS